MKKFFLMAALAFSALNMNAQKVRFGINAGAGISSVVGSEAKAYGNAFAYKIGATVDIPTSEHFSFISGVDFINKSFEAPGENYNRFFLQLPVMAAYKFDMGESSKLTLKAGPYVGYGVVSSDIKGTDLNFFKDDYHNRGDFGFKAGISFDFSHFTVGAEYSRAIRKINDDLKAYNQVYGIMLGYKF